RSHVIWCGDFNRHHLLWDDLIAGHLFTPHTIKEAELLIQAISDSGLVMALKSGTPTLQHSVTKRWLHPDNIWILSRLAKLVTFCDTLPDQR
ncbi:hypothetical protein K488DRAFT_20545, partial [Vararia minispora EC-137]